MKKKKRNDSIASAVYIFPSAALLLVFVIAPIFLSIYFSFTEYNGFRPPQWIGLENYVEAFQDLGVQAALKNTCVFTLVSVPVEIGLSLAIAGLIAAKFRDRFGSFVRSVLFVPVLCSTALVGTIFSFVFAANQDAVVNTILQLFGIAKVNWLGSEKTALGVLIAVNTWKDVGYYLVILYAGIMDIPNTLYEAAEIDGASKLQQFFRITIPNLKSVLFMVITVCTIWSFQFFDLSYTMTLGGPGYSTTSLVFQLYLQGFRDFNFGYANAIAVILFALILLVNVVQRWILKDED